MKSIKLSLVLAFVPISLFAADPITANPYFQDKMKVVADAKADCGPQADMIVKTSPQALKDSKGEKNLRDRALAVCVYSLGALEGEELTRKAMGRVSDVNAPKMAPDDLDEVQKMRSTMVKCANEVMKSGIAVSRQYDEMLYCMFKRGAEAGRDFVLASKPAK